MKHLSLVGCCNSTGKARNNLISVLPPQVFHSLVNLETLDLNSLGLTNVSGDLFANNRQLISINMSSLNLTDLPDSLFRDLVNLRELNLNLAVLGSNTKGGYYRLSPHLLDQNTALQKLSLMGYAYKVSGPGNILINFSFLQSLPSRLVELSVTGAVFDLPSAERFPHFDHLEKIHFNFVKGIEHVFGPQLMASLPQLKTLKVTSARLANVPEKTFDLAKNLESLDLRYNDLGDLPLGLFKNNSRLTLVWLEGNPGYSRQIRAWRSEYPWISFY